MDPYQTYLDMFAAMRDGEFENARELALALKDWFAKGGFYPYQVTETAMHAYIASVLRRTAGHGPAPAFSLVCRYCDAGDGLATEAAAIAEGWSEIELALALPMANYCGLCPDCKTRDQ
ncbi:hypothetical protein [Anatilimnocola floriformis]|uniref:hypothetical protein n=1 Tax=Anatilimnocola floriformis TaxID=2948575 RepID=UPI0020C455C6|nr:hypothetical protein [Anatilimnocola floriformis]